MQSRFQVFRKFMLNSVTFTRKKDKVKKKGKKNNVPWAQLWQFLKLSLETAFLVENVAPVNP